MTDPDLMASDILTLLSDPMAVFLNMLRGGIAKPSPVNIWHLYGQELADAMPAEFMRHKPTDSGWQPIDTCPMWQVAFVTDGEQVAKAQKAETDFDGFYWAIEPEDCLEWEPTHWIEALRATSETSSVEGEA